MGKNSLKIALSLTVCDIHTFSFCAKIQYGRQKWRKLKFFPLCIGHSYTYYNRAGQKFDQNRSISYGFQDIHTFSFSAKIQDGRQKWRKLKIFPFAYDTLVVPCRSKIRSKLLYLSRFSRYSHFFIFRKNQSSYYLVSYGPKALKICHYTVHQKVGEQHI